MQCTVRTYCLPDHLPSAHPPLRVLAPDHLPVRPTGYRYFAVASRKLLGSTSFTTGLWPAPWRIWPVPRIYAGNHVGADSSPRNIFSGNRLLHPVLGDLRFDSPLLSCDLRHQIGARCTYRSGDHQNIALISCLAGSVYCPKKHGHTEAPFLHGNLTGMQSFASLIGKIDTSSCSRKLKTLCLRKLSFSHLCCSLHLPLVAGNCSHASEKLSVN